MDFNEMGVPRDLVQIVNITKKDGSPLDPDNWRHKNIGIVTFCTFAGGFKKLTPCFHMKIRTVNGKVKAVNLRWSGNASTGADWPVEVGPGVWDFETNTSIYRFRILTDEESQAVINAVEAEMNKEMELFLLTRSPLSDALLS